MPGTTLKTSRHKFLYLDNIYLDKTTSSDPAHALENAGIHNFFTMCKRRVCIDRNDGWIVEGCLAESPAEEAGILQRDRILEIGALASPVTRIFKQIPTLAGWCVYILYLKQISSAVPISAKSA